ncbi:MAG: hypothetical protein AAGB32_04800, partial [Pseudomonadota bacterium]
MKYIALRFNSKTLGRDEALRLQEVFLRETIRELPERFKIREAFDMKILDNEGGTEEAVILGLEDITRENKASS